MSKPSRTTFLALAVLHDAICRSDAGALKPPEHGVRLALAYLWSITLDKDREPYDELWRALTRGEPYIRDRFRTTMGRTLFARICQHVGVKQDVTLGTALAQAVEPKSAS